MSTNSTKYGAKKAQQVAGTYHGKSPFFVNIPEFQYLKPLHLYSHLQQPGMKVPNPNRKKPEIIEDYEEEAT